MPTGSVTFKDGTTTLGTAMLVSGTATFATSALDVGDSPHALTAVYGGDGSFGGSASGATSYAITKASAEFTSLTSSTSSSVFGQTVTFTAVMAAAAPSTAAPTGSVEFMEGTTELGTGALTGGTATLDYSLLDVAGSPHAITAVYNGDANFNSAASSAPLEQSVTQAATATAITASPNPSVAGQPVTFTITVSAAAPGAGTPTGTVTLTGPSGPIALASNTLVNGKATYTMSPAAAGSLAFTAGYSGDANFQASTSPSLTQVVNRAATTTTVTANPNPSAFGQSVTLTATVAAQPPGASAPTGAVTFMEGTTTLGSGPLAGGTATFSTSSLAPGSHNVTAVYAGDANFATSTSSAVTQERQQGGYDNHPGDAQPIRLRTAGGPHGHGRVVGQGGPSDGLRRFHGRHDQAGHGDRGRQRHGHLHGVVAGGRLSVHHGRLRGGRKLRRQQQSRGDRLDRQGLGHRHFVDRFAQLTGLRTAADLYGRGGGGSAQHGHAGRKRGLHGRHDETGHRDLERQRHGHAQLFLAGRSRQSAQHHCRL